MSDPTPPQPAKHHNYKSWTSTWRDSKRKSHSKRFGKVGEVTRAEAIRRWRAWLETTYPAQKKSNDAAYSVQTLCKDFFAELQKGYQIDGKHTTTITRARIALESFAAMYGTEEADDMNAGKVAGWLESFINSRLVGKGKTRTKGSVNLALNYIKRMYQWGMTYKGVSSVAAGGVVLVRNIRGDHPQLRRKAAVRSVSFEDFAATCAKATPTIKAMIELMWWTGARPGEVRSLRPCDIDISREVWVYAPARHKNTWRGKQRFICIGPRARAILEPILPAKTDANVFVHQGKAMTVNHFAQSLAAACRRAGVEVWHPNMLRHSFATRVRHSQGSQAVQDLLGHATLNQQQTYVDDTVKRAVEIAREVG